MLKDHFHPMPFMKDVALQRIDRTKPREGDNVIWLSEIYDYLKKGMRARTITQLRPEIRPETVTLARAFLIAHHREDYEKNIAKQETASLGYTILIDENMPTRLIAALTRQFGHVMHTNYAGLKGTKDPQLWDWAIEHNIDAIFTHDKAMKSAQDLTQLAVMKTEEIIHEQFDKGTHHTPLSMLPLIVHVRTFEDNGYGKSAHRFLKHAQEIADHIENRQSPYIEVKEHGIQPGPSLLQIRDGLDIRSEPDAVFRSRQDSWIEKWRRMILKEREGPISDEEYTAIMEKVTESAAICTTPERNIKQYTRRKPLPLPKHTDDDDTLGL